MSPARSPHEVIVSSIYFDYNPTANAERILANLRAEGYEVVPSGVDLPELKRIFDEGTVSFEQATYWFNRAFEMGKEAA